jgi:hypothetical protein
MLLYAVVISTWVREGRLHIESVRTPARSDRTLRDGSFGWRRPWHFVPATITPSLRDAFSPAPLGHNQAALIDT